MRSSSSDPVALGLGVLRYAAVVPLLIGGTAAVLGAATWPGRVRGMRPALWMALGVARVFALIVGLKVRASEPERLRRHRGLVLPNHQSYLDAIIPLVIGPARFLSTAGVQKLPFIGWMASAVGTLFVNRGSGDSRAAAREAVAGKLAARPWPPLYLFPEGAISPDSRILPLRRGAFEIAREAGVEALVVAIVFSDPEAVRWRKGEWLPRAFWRLAARRGPLVATVTPLQIVDPDDAADRQEVADAAQLVLAEAVGVGVVERNA